MNANQLNSDQNQQAINTQPQNTLAGEEKIPEFNELSKYHQDLFKEALERSGYNNAELGL